MRVSVVIGLIMSIFAVIIIGGSVYTIDETEQAIILQFGKPVG